MTVIPSLAVCHPSVSHALYAVSTLSMGVNNTCYSGGKSGSWNIRGNLDSTELFMRHAQEHYGRSLTALRTDLAAFDDDNSDAVIACSLLLVPFEMVCSRIKRQQRLSETTNTTSDVSKRHPLNLGWMRVIRGIGSVMPSIQRRQCWQTSRMRPYFTWQYGQGTHEDIARMPDEFSVEDLAHYQTLSRDPTFMGLCAGYTAVKRLRREIADFDEQRDPDNENAVDQQSKRICLASLETLRRVVCRVFVTEPDDLYRALVLWVAQTDDSFFTLLERQHILALSVFAHFCAFMTLLEEDWFAGQFGIESLEDILAYNRYDTGSSSISDYGQALTAHDELFRWPAEVHKGLQPLHQSCP